MSRARALSGLVALTIGAAATLASTTAGATPGAVHSVTSQRTGLTVELIDQDLVFAPGDTIEFVYRITGDLDAGNVTLPTTTTTTTTTTAPATTTTTTTATTVPLPPDEAVPPTAAPATQPQPTTTPTTATPTTTTTSTTVPLPPPSLTVDVANFAPIDRSDDDLFDRILGQTARPGAFRNNIDGVRFSNAREMIEIVSPTEAVLTIAVPTDVGGDEELSGPDSLEFPTPGFSPIRMQLLIDDDLVATHGTMIERRPGPTEIQRQSEPVTLSLVAAVGRSNGSDADVAATNTQVNEVIDAAASMQPTLLASLPPDAVALLDAPADAAIALEDDEVTTLTDIDLDVSSAVAAGVPDVFTRALNNGEDIVTGVLRQAPTRVIWVANRPVSAGGAQLLRDLGVRAIVMTPSLYATTIAEEVPNTDRLIELPLPDGRVMPILLVDEFGSALTPEAADQALDAANETEWAIRTAIELVLDHRQNGRTVRRSRLLAGPELTPVDARLVNALAAVAELTPDLRFAAPSALIGQTDVQRRAADEPTFPDLAGPDLTARLQRINDAKLSLTSVSSMFTSDGERTADWFAQLDELISTSIDESTANATIDGVLRQADDVRQAIVLPDPFTFTLTGNTDEITVRLGNTSDEALRVILRLSSSKLDFPENDRLLTLRPNDSTDVQVPVRARSNGTSAVNVTVLTPFDEQLGEPVVLTSRVNALTGLGQVLTAGFILVLATWWIANWRKRRTNDPDGNSDSDGDDTADSANAKDIGQGGEADASNLPSS